MPSPEYSPFIPPLNTSPYESRRGVVPSPGPEQDLPPADMRRHRPHAGWTPQHEGWTPPALVWQPPPPPAGYTPYATPRHGPRPPGPTPVQPAHPLYGASPWSAFPPPPAPGHVPPYPYGPGPSPHGSHHGPPVYGPSPYQPYHPTPHSGNFVYPSWGTPSGVAPHLDHDPMGGSYLPTQRPEEGAISVNKWDAGPNYGPVLTPFHVAVLDVKLQVNPLLRHPGDNPSPNQPFLIYNVLFPVGKARRSNDPPSRSWYAGRGTPATWPRVTKLNIISREFPWVFEIHASRPDRGVTCLDVIEGLYESLQALVPRHEVGTLKGQKGEMHKRRMYDVYHHNRSTSIDAPGGSLGEGLRKVDWLINRVMFDGIVDDQPFVQEKLGIKGRGWNGLKKLPAQERIQSWPATFALKMDVRFSDREADRESVTTEATDATDETHTQVSEEVNVNVGEVS